jgi:hypothetical protein
MTMMVLAIRLYDAGLRDDAVFWFYVAKDRLAWIEENPYAAMFMEQIPARQPDRKALAARALAEVKEGAAKERA